MTVEIHTIAGCPHAQTAVERLNEAIALADIPNVRVQHTLVTTPEQAEQIHFAGSPTFLINGKDPFGSSTLPTGMTCRLYRAGAELRGCPTTEELRQALAATPGRPGVD